MTEGCDNDLDVRECFDVTNIFLLTLFHEKVM
jgi:hypothetical protein